MADPRIAFFDKTAETWDEDGPPIAETVGRLEILKEALGIKPGLDVLEVGCGTGQVTPWLVEQVSPGTVTAIDFSAEMLDRASLRGAAAEYHCIDVCSEPVGESCFDLIFCMHVFPHFRDVSAAMENLRRAMKPGSQFVILHLNSWKKINSFHDQVGGIVATDLLPAPEKWSEIMTKVDLRLDRLQDSDDLLLVSAKS